MGVRANLESCLVMAMFLIAIGGGVAVGQIIYVDADANGLNDGSSWTDAYNYLQDALALASNSDEIRVAEGIYTPDSNSADPNGSGDRTATFQLINGVAIRGSYAGFGEPDPNAGDIELYETILSGDLDGNDIDVNEPWDLWNEPTRAENSYHVVVSIETDETVVLDGLTITGGNANGQSYPVYQNFGGGIYCQGSRPPGPFPPRSGIDNGTIVGNGDPGIFYDSCDATIIITNCIITQNTAGSGGGICFDYANNAMLTNCTFSGNSALGGGGIWSRESNPDIINCTIGYNSARFNGGGMRNRDRSSPTLTGCLFIANSAKYGGGMSNSYSASASLTNCLFSGNWAKYGGGMLNEHSNSTLTNCTFSENSAEEDGGGMYGYASSHPVLTNCIFWANSDRGGMDESAQIHGNHSNLPVVNYTCIQNWTGALGGIGNIGADPRFVEPGYWDVNGVWVEGDYHLLADSPCIDTGDPNYVPEPNEIDLDGRPRVVGGQIDMGAYEYSPAIPAEVRIVPRMLNLSSEGKWITSLFWLPEDYNVADIEPNSVLLEFLDEEIKAELLWLDEEQQVAIVRFSRSEVQGILAPGEVELTVSGELADGTVFEGTDVIRVIDKGKKK